MNANRNTEERIWTAATELFYERGYHATTMRDVAACVGIKVGSIYNHFPSKDELLFRIVHDTMLNFLAGAHRALVGIDGSDERLRALIKWHVVFHALHRQAAKVADDELLALQPDARSRVIRLRDEYESMMKAVLREGETTLGWQVVDLTVVTIGIETMCTAVAVWFRDDGRLSPQQIATIFADFALRALTPATPA